MFRSFFYFFSLLFTLIKLCCQFMEVLYVELKINNLCIIKSTEEIFLQIFLCNYLTKASVSQIQKESYVPDVYYL